jgi:hypothetical protein
LNNTAAIAPLEKARRNAMSGDPKQEPAEEQKPEENKPEEKKPEDNKAAHGCGSGCAS